MCVYISLYICKRRARERIRQSLADAFLYTCMYTTTHTVDHLYSIRISLYIRIIIRAQQKKTIRERVCVCTTQIHVHNKGRTIYTFCLILVYTVSHIYVYRPICASIDSLTHIYRIYRKKTAVALRAKGGRKYEKGTYIYINTILIFEEKEAK